jgi:hypothetical protein
MARVGKRAKTASGAAITAERAPISTIEPNPEQHNGAEPDHDQPQNSGHVLPRLNSSRIWAGISHRIESRTIQIWDTVCHDCLPWR